METCILFCCLGTMDRNETELHSRRRHSDSRIAADCDCPRPLMDLDSGMQIVSGKLLESTFICIKPQVHIMSGCHNYYFGAETFFCQRCCDTLFWPIFPCLMLSPIQTRPRDGARPSLPEVILPHL
jgi:hypothetical protein